MKIDLSTSEQACHRSYFSPAKVASMPEYVFLSRPMQHLPATLDIARGDPIAALRAFVIKAAASLWLCPFLAFQVFAHASEGPNWENGFRLFFSIALALTAVSYFRAFIANLRSGKPYITMNKSGLACSLPTRWSTSWSDIEACAFKADNGRTVLRLFLRGKSQRTHDIDFALAAQPKLSLEKAMVACAAWIVAARNPAETTAPVRNFVVERAARSGWQSRPAKPAFIILWAALVVLVAVVTLAAVGRPVREEPPMAVDARPARTVLFLGNSRIAQYDLPHMVRDVADSAHSPIRYDIHMRAWGAATLRQHWNNDGNRTALSKPWDLVVLQPESAAFMEGSARDTNYYGARLSAEAEAGGSQVALMANWGLGPSFFSGDRQAATAAARAYAAKVGRETRALARLSGAGVIDLEGAFAEAEASVPEVAMTEDGNHPSHAGTFLAALVIYGYLSHADLANIDWRPYDMSNATAKTLKEIAARHLD